MYRYVIEIRVITSANYQCIILWSGDLLFAEHKWVIDMKNRDNRLYEGLEESGMFDWEGLMVKGKTFWPEGVWSGDHRITRPIPYYWAMAIYFQSSH